MDKEMDWKNKVLLLRQNNAGEKKFNCPLISKN
jgi:hypothetical protein